MAFKRLKNITAITPATPQEIEPHVDLNPVYPADALESLRYAKGHEALRDNNLRYIASYFVDKSVRAEDGTIVVKGEDFGHVYAHETDMGVAVVLVPKPRAQRESGSTGYDAITINDTVIGQSTEHFCIQAAALATFSTIEQRQESA